MSKVFTKVNVKCRYIARKGEIYLSCQHFKLYVKTIKICEIKLFR